MECAGNARALEACIDAVRAQGVVVVVGLMQGKVGVSPFQLIVKDLTIQGSLCYPLTMWPRIIEMVRSGLFPVEAMVDDEIEMADVIEKGFKPLLDPQGAMMKILVRVHGDPAGRRGASKRARITECRQARTPPSQRSRAFRDRHRNNPTLIRGKSAAVRY